MAVQKQVESRVDQTEYRDLCTLLSLCYAEKELATLKLTETTNLTALLTIFSFLLIWPIIAIVHCNW